MQIHTTKKMHNLKYLKKKNLSIVCILCFSNDLSYVVCPLPLTLSASYLFLMQLPGATQAENDVDEASLPVECVHRMPECPNTPLFSSSPSLSPYPSRPLPFCLSLLFPSPLPLFCNYLFTQCLFDIEAERKVLITENVEQIQVHFPVTALTCEVLVPLQSLVRAAVGWLYCTWILGGCEIRLVAKTNTTRLWETTV